MKILKLEHLSMRDEAKMSKPSPPCPMMGKGESRHKGGKGRIPKRQREGWL